MIDGSQAARRFPCNTFIGWGIEIVFKRIKGVVNLPSEVYVLLQDGELPLENCSTTNLSTSVFD